jgi:hypothetical protein
VSDNRILRIYGPGRDELMGGWRKPYIQELHNLYFSSNVVRVIKSRRMRWAGHVARMGEIKNARRILVGKSEGKRLLRRPRRRREDNIRTYLRDKGFEGVDWTYLVQHSDRWRALVNTVMNLRVP